MKTHSFVIAVLLFLLVPLVVIAQEETPKPKTAKSSEIKKQEPTNQEESKQLILTDYDDAVATANRLKKPIFLYVYDGVWGEYCKALGKADVPSDIENQSEEFVIAYVDSKNGKSPFVNELRLGRNRSYLLILNPSSKNKRRTTFDLEVLRLTNPKSLKAIGTATKLALEMIAEEAK